MFSLRPCRPTLPEQVDGLPEGFGQPGDCLPRSDIERIAEAEAWFAQLPAKVRHGGDRAYYTIGEDRIQMPPFEAFDDAYAYYATRGHEVCNIASVLISRTVDGLCALLFPNHRTACCAISGRES